MWELKNLDTGEVKYSEDYEVDWAPRFVVTKLTGEQRWFENGGYHREDGPAIIYANGTEVWCLHDKRHREDGPALVVKDGPETWWINGKQVEPPCGS